MPPTAVKKLRTIEPDVSTLTIVLYYCALVTCVRCLKAITIGLFKRSEEDTLGFYKSPVQVVGVQSSEALFICILHLFCVKRPLL